MRISIDNQPIDATFFGEGKLLTEFITPDSLEVKDLYDSLTGGLKDLHDRILSCWKWVADEVRYKQFLSGKLWVEGKSSVQNDLWCDPSLIVRTKVGNCANKSFLLCSLLKNAIPGGDVNVVLGNLTSNGVGGHAWVTADIAGREYLIEATQYRDAPLPSDKATVYEPVIVFNDKRAYMIEGRKVIEPLGYCCVDWLRDYLDIHRCDDFYRS